MGRGRCGFRKKDVERAIAAARKAGFPCSIRIHPTGAIELVPAAADDHAPEPNDWDDK